MALFTESDLRARARARTTVLSKTFDSVLREHVQKQEGIESHDIFLSHAYEDKELVLGAALAVEDLGHTVYLDWRDDPQLDRSKVTAATAERLRARMRVSKSLFFATTAQATNSKWMPWELGFMDGARSRVAIFPVSTKVGTNDYTGQEYLGIYPYVAEDPDKDGVKRLWIQRSAKIYTTFSNWLNGGEPRDHSQ